MSDVENADAVTTDATTTETQTEAVGTLLGDKSTPDASAADALTEAKAESTEGTNKEADAKEAKPVEYALTMPEGFTAEHKVAFEQHARDMGLTPEQAQKWVDISAKANADARAANMEARNKQVAAWEAELKADKEFGGDKWDANVQYYLAGVKHLDTDGSLTKLLEESGYANNPAVVKAVARIGRQLDEDKIIGKGSGGADVPLEERLFK